jgi:hypothetical protein
MCATALSSGLGIRGVGLGWVGGCQSLPLKCKVGTSQQGMGAQSLGCECTLQLAFSGRGGGASRRFKAEDASRGYVPTWQFRRIELKCIRRTRSENVSWFCMPQTRAFCRLRGAQESQQTKEN